MASSQNNLYSLNAKTGAAINKRSVHDPFLQSDIGCTDIPNYIGIIGTPVIDPATDIAYFFSKTYIPNYSTVGNTGTFNGVYYFHGVNVNTLQDVDGFPILIDGSQSDNAPDKYFVGGVILQRPSLAQIGSVVYGAFGGHCDLFNYTGLVVGVDINQKKVVTNFATESGPLVPQSNVWNQNGGGGQGGIWMSGMALSTDGNRLFWVSGNGAGHENQGTPASGSSGCRTLGEAVVNLGIGDGGDGGKLHLTDYFQPYDYQNLDGGDQDFGSGGLALLDPGTFKGTGVSKLAVTAGKNGKIYILNANNLGGYRLGSGQTDGIIQTIVTNKPVFGGSGSYPLEGGYIYSTPVGNPTYAYKLGFSTSGVPIFTLAGQSTENSAGRVGVGIPTVTTNDGKEGTAILWMCDPDAGLRAWYAVPGPDGKLKTINLPQVNGLNKFQRPVFGDTRLYVTDPNGGLYCLGSPVNLPLNCSSPVYFGQVALGSNATQQVTCKANIAITIIQSAVTGDAHFKVDPSTLPQGPVAQGASFTFPVTWDLANAQTGNTANATYGNVSPGVKSTPLTITTINAVQGYSTKFPISLTGTEVSQKAFLVEAPINVDFSGIVLLANQGVPSVTSPFTISNAGLNPLTILGYAYTMDDVNSAIHYTNVTATKNGTFDLGTGFTSNNLPPVGSALQGGAQVSVEATFYPVNGVGPYSSYLFTFTDAGSVHIILEGSASTAPIANFSISNGEGGWLPQSNLVMDFGKVAPGTTSQRQIRICNEGGSVLLVSKSKPPNGAFRPDDPTALHESQPIPVGSCAFATVLFVTNAEAPNVPDQVYTNSWTLNTDDLNFGVHVVEITGTLVSRRVGPTNSTGDAVYSYLGCFTDNNPAGRLLPSQQYADNKNDNGRCQTACASGNSVFSGTEYQTECYCGNKPPSSLYAANEASCSFACSGDPTQDCGGAGGFISIYYDATRYAPGNSSTTGPSGGPAIVQNLTGYSYLGCYSEGSAGRALTGLANPIPGNTVTPQACAKACGAYQYFGAEYAGECYCGNQINTGSALVAGNTPDVTGCSMTCNGDSNLLCGGPNRLNMYKMAASAAKSAASSTANSTASSAAQSVTPVTLAQNLTSTSSTTTSAAQTVTPTAGAVTNGWAYLGCANETTPRALSGASYSSNTAMTVESCQAFCSSSSNNYGLAGVEYGSECYCGNGLQSYSSVGYDGCNMACTGNKTELCGGPSRLSVYNLTIYVPPTTVKQVGTYLSQGCYNEASNGRLLSGTSYTNQTGMTVESCVNFCQASNATYAGLEYGRECYCSSSLPTTAVTADAGKCNMPCTGNPNEFCGSTSVLNVYKNTPSSVSAAGTPKTANTLNNAVITPNTTQPAPGSKAKRAEKSGRGMELRFSRDTDR